MVNHFPKEVSDELASLLRRIATALEGAPPRSFSVEINNDYVEYPGDKGRIPELTPEGVSQVQISIYGLRTPGRSS